MNKGGSIYTRFAAWAFLLLAALVQTWYTRHRIFSDGISYLDIATYYSRGDWSHAINSYWSPLYSWILAIPLVFVGVGSYWEVLVLHLVNLAAFVCALIAFELLMKELLRYRLHLSGSDGTSEGASIFSDLTIRTIGYCLFGMAELRLIGIGCCSPDMIASAAGFYIAYILIRIANGRTNVWQWLALGFAMGCTFLARAAFAPMILVNAAVVGWLLWRRREPWFLPVCLVCAASGAVAIPWITALSAFKGHLTLGDAGKLNYGWEVSGAARSTHWQGEPYNIGVPRHPTRRVIDRPATYTFAYPVAGSYPPWFEPSYWYDGIAPRFDFGRQWQVLRATLPLDVYLFFLSPVTFPCIALLFWTGWRLWISKNGIPAYWFLIVPSLVYIAAYSLIYMDRRYVAGTLAVLWLCLAASIVSGKRVIPRNLDSAMRVWVVLFTFVYVGSGLIIPGKLALADLVHGRETEWNLQWILAQKIRALGVMPGSQVAYVGQAINAEWARLDQSRIVAEVPVIWDRLNNINGGIFANDREPASFWTSGPDGQARVLEAFRAAGASIAFADPPPPGTNTAGWQRVLPANTTHLPWSGGQVAPVPGLLYHRLSPVSRTSL